MAGAKFQYDESGGTFFYFLLSFLALIVIPCTYYFWPRERRRENERRDKKACHCEDCNLKNNRLQAREPLRKAKQRLIKFLLILGWLALFATAYKVTHIQHDYVQWDPFEILKIDPASSMGEIKRAYRRLSLVYHPDKDTGDEKQFMMIAKAYAALTDDEARKNWEMYGNPDGPGATSFGIALPSWIVEKENSVWVLGLYALVFMVALPVAVGIWWYRSVKFGGDQVLLDTTQLYYYFIHKTPQMALKRVIMILAASLEFEHSHNNEVAKRASDNEEVPQLIKELHNLGEKNKERPLCFYYSIKARALIHAHLSRMKLPDTLNQDRLYVVKKCPYLLQEFVQCISQMTMLYVTGRIQRGPSLESLEHSMKLCSMVVQGMWENKSALMQLPHINEDMLKHFQTRKRNVRSIRQLACMKSEDRRLLLRSLSQNQYEDILYVLSKMPLIEMEVRSEVLDDEDSGTITAGAIVTVNVMLTRKDYSSIFEQELDSLKDSNSQIEDLAEHEVNGTLENHLSNNTSGLSAQQTTQQQWKPKAWEKQKKKKGGRGSKSKKKAVPTKVTAKKLQMSNVKTPDSTSSSGVTIKELKSKEGSGSESESESENSEQNNSEDEVQEVKEEKEPEKEVEDKESDKDEEDWEKFQQEMTKKDKVLETKSKKSHTVHCPLFPEDKQEYWWIYMTDRKTRTLATVPYLMTSLVDVDEVDLKFTAPIKPGTYSFSVNVRSDSYVDFDLFKVIKMDVKEAKEVDMKNVQWEISDEDEDKEDEEDSAVEDSDLASDDDDAEN